MLLSRSYHSCPPAWNCFEKWREKGLLTHTVMTGTRMKKGVATKQTTYDSIGVAYSSLMGQDSSFWNRGDTALLKKICQWPCNRDNLD